VPAPVNQVGAETRITTLTIEVLAANLGVFIAKLPDSFMRAFIRASDR